ncbi:SDR family NAD(P)-dependent oxidoreductase [Paeniglutamicibacter sp. NPDC091659]|uniref:SDR family NAD(P)-dependent oxidoreductase n=1 Tax=Paeniglutamicibacter sp. NPDC091659 TaxID=3364389 RepID=UPI0037FB3006
MSGLHEGRRVVVTGATRGIGQAIARRFASEGASVALIGRDKAAGEETCRTIEENGGRAFFVQSDLQDLEGIPRLLSQVRSKLSGDVDLLCHAAGIYPERPLREMTRDAWDQVMNLNLTAGMLLMREAIPDLTRSEYGRVVMISSITGPRTGVFDLSHYAASKGGLEALVRTAAVELAQAGITVNSVAPGTILTENLKVLYAGEGVLQDVVSRIPVGRVGLPEDVAATVSFLGSRDASFITGQSIVVDGGQTIPEVQR